MTIQNQREREKIENGEITITSRRKTMNCETIYLSETLKPPKQHTKNTIKLIEAKYQTKKLSTNNFISSNTIILECRKNAFQIKKWEKFVASKHKLKELPKEAQRLKKNYTNWKLISWGRMKNIENGKHKLIINDFSFPQNFLKMHMLK